MNAPTAAANQSQMGSRAIRASFAYGKLDTIASASSAIAATATVPGRRRPMSVARPSTAAIIVVGTPQKKRPSFGVTLNRASRIAAHAATRTQAAATAGVGAVEWIEA